MRFIRASNYMRPQIICGCTITKSLRGFHEITHCDLHSAAVELASALAEM